MDTITLLTTIFIWLVANGRRQLLLSYWWQIKEYRKDRLLLFLKTEEGRRRLETYLILPKIILALLLLLTMNYSRKEFAVIFLVILGYEAALFILDIARKSFKRPELSIRGRNAVITSIFFLITSSLVFLITKNVLSLVLLDLIAYLIPALAAAWTIIPYNQTLKKELKQAKAKLQKIHPYIIGITGSQGKSSTKHFLFDLLNSHFNTVKTPLSHNTIFAIIRSVNQFLMPKTKYFLVEMGAYKKGDIADLTKIAQPSLAMITGISPQHLGLFGSLEKIIEAKYELVSALPPKSPVFINTSSKSTLSIMKMALQDKHQIHTYALNQPATFSAKIIKQTDKDSNFIVSWNKKDYEFTTPLTVNHLIENLTGAIAVSLYLKTPYTKLKTTISNIKTPDRAINIKKITPNIEVIDDSYNSTLPGFKSALNELQKHKGTKIVITSGISELGSEEYQTHKKLGEKMNDIDHIFLTTPHLAKPILEGIKSKKLTVISPENFKSKLKPYLKRKTTILLEGRLPSKIVNNINQLK